jgi:hypothetical protein
LVLVVLILAPQMAVLEIILYLTLQLLVHIQVVLLPMVAVLAVRRVRLAMLVALVVVAVEDVRVALVYQDKEMQGVLDKHQLQVHIKVAAVAARELLGYNQIIVALALVVMEAQELQVPFLEQ